MADSHISGTETARELLQFLLHEVRVAAGGSKLTYPERDYMRELCDVAEALAKPLPLTDDVRAETAGTTAYLEAKPGERLAAYAEAAIAAGAMERAARKAETYLGWTAYYRGSIQDAKIVAQQIAAEIRALSAQSPLREEMVEAWTRQELARAIFEEIEAQRPDAEDILAPMDYGKVADRVLARPTPPPSIGEIEELRKALKDLLRAVDGAAGGTWVGAIEEANAARRALASHNQETSR